MVENLAGQPAGVSLPCTAPAQHHLLTVLRLGEGRQVEVFDAAGWTAQARLRQDEGAAWVLVLATAARRHPRLFDLAVAVAAPRGERADWLVEKLTELGVTRIDWLLSARSQPHSRRLRGPRWARIAGQAAGQAHAAAPPEVGSAAQALDAYLAALPDDRALFVADPTGAPMAALVDGLLPCRATVVVGPEGGLTGDELAGLRQVGARALRLSTNILRVETAAVAAAALLTAVADGPTCAGPQGAG